MNPTLRIALQKLFAEVEAQYPEKPLNQQLALAALRARVRGIMDNPCQGDIANALVETEAA